MEENHGKGFYMSWQQIVKAIPPKEELVARIAGGLVGKVRELMLLLDATTRDFSGLIEARAVQLEAENDDS